MLSLKTLPSFVATHTIKKIVIFGCPGSGKTTLARKLSEITQLPIIHVDKEYWLPGWVKPPRPEWLEKLSAFTARKEWIFEGTFSTTLNAVIDCADLVVFTDRSTGICLWRCLTRKPNRQEIPTGCNDNFINRFSFQFLYWVLRFNRQKRPSLMELIKNQPHTLALQSDQEYAEFLKIVTKHLDTKTP